MRQHNIMRAIVMMLVVTILAGNTYQVKAAVKNPTLEILTTNIPEGRAGSPLDVTLTLKNTSNFIAKNVIIKPIITESLPVILNELNLKKSKDYISPNKEFSFDYTLDVKRSAQEGVYPLTFNITYVNTDGASFTQQETIYFKVTFSHIPTELVVTTVDFSKDVVPGEEFDASISIQNSGTLVAENIRVSLEASDKFAIKDNRASYFMAELGGFTTRAFKFTMIPSKDLKAGNYPLTVTMKYTDGFGKQQTKTRTIYVTIKGEGSQGKTDIKLENVKGPGTVQAEKSFDISFDLSNKGTATAEDASVTAQSDEGLLVPLSLNKQIIGALKAGETKKMKFSFKGLQEIKTKNYPIKIEIKYGDKEKETLEQYVGVLIQNDKSSSTTTVPVIIIDTYESNPQIVNAGETFDLNLKLWNTNKEKAVQNMKVTLRVNGSSDANNDDVFTPVGGSNTFYVPSLSPGQKWDEKITFFTVPDAKAKTYKVEASFQYEYDQNGTVTTGTGQDIIGIPVVQPTKLEVGDLVAPMGAEVGKESNIELSYYNTGKVPVGNLLIKIEGDFDVREGTNYVGSFNSGTQDWFTASVIPTKEGESKGKVIFTYEDTSGKAQSIEKEFTIMAGPAKKEEEPGLVPVKPIDDKKSSKMPYILGAVALLIIAGIVVVVKKRKGKGMNIDDTL